MVRSTIYEKLLRSGNGFVNLFEVQARVASIDATEKTIHLLLNPLDPRHTIEVSFRNKYPPSFVAVGEIVRVHGYIRGIGQGIFQLRSLAFSNPLDLSIFHGEAAKDWAKATGYRMDDRSYKLSRQESKRRDNYVRVQGFLDGIFMSRGTEIKNSVSRTPDCLHILIRQFSNPELSIPLRLYGNRPEARKIGDNLENLFRESMYQGRRIPIDVLGSFHVSIRNEKGSNPGDEPVVVRTRQIRAYAIRVFSSNELQRFSPFMNGDMQVDHYEWASQESGMWVNKLQQEEKG